LRFRGEEKLAEDDYGGWGVDREENKEVLFFKSPIQCQGIRKLEGGNTRAE
jgi:hypothetical protein